MAILVAFDTVFEQCSVAILQTDDGLSADAAQIIYSDTTAGARGQTQIILPMVERALAASGISMTDVDAWAFNRGPGAFSGIRINTAVVQALSVANGAPCVGISSLTTLAAAAMAAGLAEGTRVAAAIDARQNQVYLGEFIVQAGKLMPVIDPNNPYGNERLADYGSQVAADIVVGNGAQLIDTQARIITLNPTADDIARLALPEFAAGRAVAADAALPVYLRDNAWKTLAEQGKAKS